MFDARSILDALARGSGQPQGASPSARGDGGLDAVSDLLKQLAGGDAADAQAPRAPTRTPPPESMPRQDDPALSPRRGADIEDQADARTAGGGGGLGDILNEVLAGKGGGLKDILEQMQKGGGGLGGLGAILGPVLGQVLGGGGAARGGAARLTDEQASDLAGTFAQATGRSPEEIFAQIKDLVSKNQFGAGMAAGGLGGLILGTNSGRSLAATAAKLGGLALIGGLAYRAYTNYQQGTPASVQAAGQNLLAPPAGSGFEAGTMTNEHATTMLRAMVAAAAADGRIDASEQQNLVASLGGSNMTDEARRFLINEINQPASIDDIAAAIGSDEEAIEVYTAARITVDPDIAEEHAFLAQLAGRLGLEPGLTAHVDASARGAGLSV